MKRLDCCDQSQGHSNGSKRLQSVIVCQPHNFCITYLFATQTGVFVSVLLGNKKQSANKETMYSYHNTVTDSHMPQASLSGSLLLGGLRMWETDAWSF